ncbi:rhomboid family intramembrane serine protease [Dokdonella sp.]|uniref:rhomboid family intramembrane serine protease n=1 Tax=Dokdonella sp. TaxID=2291710 RepID=UPI0031C66916|nr:rhomboid family intramembrane serine protease [Dokdonella sp.]
MFVNLPSRRKPQPPWATMLIVAACMLAFLWLSSLPAAERLGVLTRWGTVPSAVLDSHVPWGQQLIELRALRLVSAIFIHADWLHVTGNMLFLIVFGVPAERTLGTRRYLALFVLGGALANLVGAAMLAGTHAPIVGSSGAVSTVVGAYLALFPRARLGLVLPLGAFLEFVRIPAPLLIGFWAMLQLLFTYIGPAFGAIAWWTHVSGFAIGVLFALLSRPAIARRLRN